MFFPTNMRIIHQLFMVKVLMTRTFNLEAWGVSMELRESS